MLNSFNREFTPRFDLYLRRIFYFYLLYLSVITLMLGWRHYQMHDSWVMGDWLINYQGGWTRRGLIGEIILQISHLLSLSPGFLVFLLFSSCYLGYFGFVYLLVRRLNTFWPFSFLLFSPYFLAFQVNDPPGGFRKEIILLCLASFVIWFSKSVPHIHRKSVLALTTLSFPFLILGHELMAVFLPAFLAIMLDLSNGEQWTGRYKVIFAVSVVASVSFFLYISISPVIPQSQAAQIHAALEKFSYPIDDSINSGAITWLTKSVYAARAHLKHLWHKGHYGIKYPLALFLALIGFIPVFPVVSTGFYRKKYVLALFFVTWLGTLVVATVAVDWGRLIYINLSLLALYALSQDTKEFNTFFVGPKIFVVFLFLYAVFWHIPNCCEYSIQGTYLINWLFP